jgi:hypothetical protein
MQRRLILPLLLAAVAHSSISDAQQKQNGIRDGSTEQRAIIIPHSKRPFHDLAWEQIQRRYPVEEPRALSPAVAELGSR